jgi:hypothetical protein
MTAPEEEKYDTKVGARGNHGLHSGYPADEEIQGEKEGDTEDENSNHDEEPKIDIDVTSYDWCHCLCLGADV